MMSASINNPTDVSGTTTSSGTSKSDGPQGDSGVRNNNEVSNVDESVSVSLQKDTTLVLVEDDGESSDSDALLPATSSTPNQTSLSTPDRPSKITHTSRVSSAKAQRSQSLGSDREMGIDIFSQACSPLLSSATVSFVPPPSLPPSSANAIALMNSAIAIGDNENEFGFKIQHSAHDRTASPMNSTVSSSKDDYQGAFHDGGLLLEQQTPGIDNKISENSGTEISKSDRSLSYRQQQSPSPRTTFSQHSPISNQVDFVSVSPVPLHEDPSNIINFSSSPIPTANVRTTSQQSTSSEEQDGLHPPVIVNGLHPPVIVNRDRATSSRPASPSAVSSAPSSHSNNISRETRGVESLRRVVRSRALGRNSSRTTGETPSSQLSTTQSLGEEDLFALTINGEDPRLPNNVNNNNNNNTAFLHHHHPPQHVLNNNISTLQSTPQRSSREAARMHSSENFPPIVWEESTDTELEAMERGGRQRTFSEPYGNRIRNFFFPRAISPGVRRRGSRQSRSVRRRIHRSSSESGAVTMSPLSTTAAAVLFTSSQASIDSIQDYGIGGSGGGNQSSRRRQQLQQHQQQQYNNRYGNPIRATSNSTLDDSARALGTIDRSTIADSGGGDAMSISTMGNSTMARSDNLIIASGDGSIRQSTGRGQHPVAETNILAGASNNNNAINGTAPDVTDPSREARVRWVRINRRFQLMVTCVAILFTVLLFSILISWIVLTSAYVVAFDKACDVPLKFFYWLVTLQLILDIFRNDILRHILQWDPASHTSGTTHQAIPARVVAYNIAYLAYAMLVLRMGVSCVYIEGRQPDYSCRSTAPELFQSSTVFVTLMLGAWATVILGYLVPFCFVAVLLTWNGYNPGFESVNEARVASGPIPGGVFPSAYSNIGAPPICIELLREIDLDECGENCPQECCICMEDFRSGDVIVETDCRHILHKNCCSVWLRQARTCPVCRTDIPNAQQDRLRQQQLVGEGPSLGDERESQQGLGQPPMEAEGQPQRPRGPVSPRPTRVHINSPHLPFRPAGRHEVETLIRAFRQQGRRREQRRGSRRTTTTRGGELNSNSSARSTRQSLRGSVRSHRDRTHSIGNREQNAGIEISTLNGVHTLNPSSSYTNVDEHEAQFVL